MDFEITDMSFNNNNNNNGIFVMNLNVACCLCIRNCAPFLPSIFENLTLLSKHFARFNVIFVFDNCSDNSESLLLEFKKISMFTVYVFHNINNNECYRTCRIANSRNVCLDFVYNIIKDVDFHFMLDSDNVNVPKWNIPLIKRSLLRNDWDALSFNLHQYYDIWALIYGPIKHHCWGFNSYEKTVKTIRFMEKDIAERLDLLDEDELFVCYSAFNGFSIYRTPIFKGCIYDGFYQNIKHFLSDEDRSNTIQYLSPLVGVDLSINDSHPEICEHVFFHMSASMNNGARIRISKEFVVETPIKWN